MPSRSRTTRRMNSAGKKRSSRHSRNRVGTSGQASSGHGFSNGVPDWSRHVRRRLGRHVGRDVVEEQRDRVVVVGDPALELGLALVGPPRARCWPTSRRATRPATAPSPRRAPAARTGTRSHTSGAVNPAIDWATRTRSRRGRRSRRTTRVGVLGEPGRVVVARQVDRDDVVAPRSRSSGTTRCQYQESEPAPWISTYVAMALPSFWSVRCVQR